ncbi:MAG: M56 family metallopeptidase [Pirellulaceae bacterium]|nr:M56 family metallopeptidase [Pirellulaceae bacterium]
MTLVEWLAQPWCRPLALVLLHFVWQGTLIAFVLAVAVELLGIRRQQDRHAASLLALVLMALCPLATALYFVGSGLATPVDLETLALAASPAIVSAPAAGVAAGSSWLEIAQPYALALWLTGVSFFAARLLLGLAGVRRLRRDLLPLPADLAERVALLGRRLGMEARPLVHLSRHVSEAIAVGIVRPLVLIPATWATEMPAALLEAVIAHELAHLRRHDLWINLVQRVVETLLFYHPAVWWLSRRLRTERELCCDALAVAATGRRLEYAQALENVARRQVARVQPLLAAGIRGEKNMRLLQRVRNVLGMSAAAERSRLWPAGLAVAALPLALWAAATVFSSSGVADEERKEGDAPRREGAEVRREGDAPRREGVREGDAPRREGARDGDAPRREGAPRDGERPAVREGARDGERPATREGEGERRPVVRDGDRPAGTDARTAELMALVRKLSAEVEHLRAELAAARGGKYPVKEGVREGGDKPGVKKEEPRREGGDKPAIKKEGGDKPGVKKEGGDNPAIKKEGAREGGDKPAIKKEGGDKPQVKEGGDKPQIKKEGVREGGDKPQIKKEEPRREGEVRKEG